MYYSNCTCTHTYTQDAATTALTAAALTTAAAAAAAEEQDSSSSNGSNGLLDRFKPLSPLQVWSLVSSSVGSSVSTLRKGVGLGAQGDAPQGGTLEQQVQFSVPLLLERCSVTSNCIAVVLSLSLVTTTVCNWLKLVGLCRHAAWRHYLCITVHSVIIESCYECQYSRTFAAGSAHGCSMEHAQSLLRFDTTGQLLVTVKQDATAGPQSLSELRAQATQQQLQQQQQQQSEAEQQEDLEAAEVLTAYTYHNLSCIDFY
jgi:hypothetical protein